MKIFISWSGKRSRYVAEALRDWLPNVIQAIEPWISSEDLRKGKRWGIELANALLETNFGIIVLTPENLNSDWLLFEAGALSKSVDEAFVMPYLVDLKPTNVSGPLSEFQATEATQEDTKKLILTINESLDDNQLPAGKVLVQFNKWWPDLKAILKEVPSMEGDTKVEREDREILEEVLSILRNQIKEPESWHLTAPEVFMLRLLKDNPDVSSQAISKRMAVSHSTLRNMLSNVYKKLGVTNLTDALNLAVDTDIL